LKDVESQSEKTMAATEAKNDDTIHENEDANAVINLESEDAKNQWSATTVLACLVNQFPPILIHFRA
jgi:hypothetical protein